MMNSPQSGQHAQELCNLKPEKNHSMKKGGGHRVPLLAKELVQLTGAPTSVGPGRSTVLWQMTTHPALYKFHRSD